MTQPKEPPGIAQMRRYQEMEQEIRRIVYATDGDTDDLIDELTEWAFDRIRAERRAGVPQ